MKKHLLSFMMLFGIVSTSLAQCSWPTSGLYGTGTAPAQGFTNNIVACAFGGEATPVSGVTAGIDYVVAYSVPTSFVTVYDETNTAVAWGPTPVSFTAASTGTYHSVAYADMTCTGDFNCYDGTWEALLPCPSITALVMTGGDASSADINWTAGSTETMWNVEWGAPGFTPGTATELGSTIVNTTPGYSITGLPSNQNFDVYVQSDCGADQGNWVLVVVNTFNQPAFMATDTQCPTAGFVDISATGTDAALTDDGTLGVSIPFPFVYQGSLTSQVTIANNGYAVLNTLTGPGFSFGDMTTQLDGLYPWGDDLDTETGNVYYETVGTSPNQTFIIQWDNSCNWPGAIGGPTVTFQIQIDEATGEIYFVYDNSIFGGANAADDNGANAAIGIAGPAQDINVSLYDNTYLSNNSCAHFYYTDCPNPSNYAVTYTTSDEGAVTWASGLASETDWTVIYGPEGFDPMTGGTTINTTSPAAIFPGLDDITTYDVYIYADCNPGVLQSDGALFGQFTTLPNCSDVTLVNATTAVDSLFTDWAWTESSGIGTYASTGFNLQYGGLGFMPYDGTETVVNADNNLTDTTEDMTLLGGGVYEVYVQAVCGTDTSNWVGPVEFVMPLTNDSTCNAIDLMVDGTIYNFNNAAATAQLNEANLAPPSTGFNQTDGWGESGITNSTWFTFTAPASGNVNLSGLDLGLDGQMAVYETTDCADVNAFTFLGGNDDAMSGGSLAPEWTICGLTPGNMYYLIHDGWNGASGNYSIALNEVAVEAGSTGGIIDICAGDTANLFTGISGYDMGGTWVEEIPTINFADSLFPSAGLAYQLYNFEYQVMVGCAYDSIIQQVQIYGPSSAGVDGSMTVCQNEPINLLQGLTGNVDLGGTWYDPSNSPLASGAITASNIPGQFNYDYITGNGVCPDDTANVVVNVDAGCDYLNLQEAYFGAMEIYPNPTSGMIFIANNGSDETFGYELTDVNGKVMATREDAINGTQLTEINLADFEPGIYMIKVSNDNATKTFRIVKQ